MCTASRINNKAEFERNVQVLSLRKSLSIFKIPVHRPIRFALTTITGTVTNKFVLWADQHHAIYF